MTSPRPSGRPTHGLHMYHIRTDRLDLDHLIDMIRMMSGGLESIQSRQFEALSPFGVDSSISATRSSGPSGCSHPRRCRRHGVAPRREEKVIRW